MVSFLSCDEEDKEYIYEVPKLNIQNYVDLIGSTRDNLIDDYPYAHRVVSNNDIYSGLRINNNLDSPYGDIYVASHFYFVTDSLSNAFINISIPDPKNNSYLEYCETLNNTYGEPTKIALAIYLSQNDKNVVTFDSYDQFKSQLAIENEKLTNEELSALAYEIVWNFKRQENGEAINIPIKILYGKQFNSSDKNFITQLLFTIGKSDNSIVDETNGSN
jgi:hypothetical protein